MPEGTVTFVFTDVDGSTKLIQSLGDRYAGVLAEHRRLLRGAMEAHGGHEVDVTGDGCFLAFASARQAVAAAADVQRALRNHTWPRGAEVCVRIGIHSGEPTIANEAYVGLDVHRAARIMAAGHGGQVLLSRTSRDLLADVVLEGVELRDLGDHRLKDLNHAQRIYQLVLDGLRNEFPPLRTLENRPNNLPAQPTPLLGREREIGELSEMLRREDVRVVTLTGTAGTGKTRLALQVAAELIERFADGVFFVALAPISDPALVLATIAQTLAVKETASETLAVRLAHYVHDRELLLVLDNLEQVLEAAPQIAELLATSRALKVLATTRAPLRVAGEREYPVPPLQLPDPAHRRALDSLSRCEAVALFVERARAVRPSFAITSDNAPAVADICVWLDGLPLPIELAAARVRVLSPEDLLKRLESRLRLLTGGSRGVAVRQQTLRGAIDWSYRLLSPAEQTLFTQLSVFVGGWDLAAAEAICGENDVTFDLLDAVTSLVEQSLVRSDEGPHGSSRFSMLETLREYGLEELRSSEDAREVGRRHAQYFAAMCRRAAGPLSGDERGEEEYVWLERMEAEQDNIRAALAWSLEARELDLALETVAAAAWFWDGRDLTEGRTWLRRVLAATGEARTISRVHALASAATFAHEQGDVSEAFSSANEALALARELSYGKGIVKCLSNLADMSAQAGETEHAENLGREALSRAKTIGDERLLGYVFSSMGFTAYYRGDYETAKALTERALEIQRHGGSPSYIANSLINIGYCALIQGDLARATTAHEEALTLTRNRIAIANCNSNLGSIALYGGDPARAKSLYEEALSAVRDLGEKRTTAESLRGMAAVAATDGDTARAARLAGAADALMNEIGARLEDPERMMNERYLVPARARAGDEVWMGAWEEGRVLSLRQAVDLALED